MSALEGGVVGFFDVASVPPPGGSTEFSLQRWEEHRSKTIEPQFHSGYSDDEQARREFLIGAELYGLRFDADAPLDTIDVIKPQQLAIVDTLSKPFDSYAVEIPRRASKTTSIFCLLMGRCATRPGYQVTFSAQTGVAGTRRLREWKMRLDRVNPPDDQDMPPWMRNTRRRTAASSRQLALFGEELTPAHYEQKRRGFRILMGEVGKGIYFDNGSQFLVLKPNAGAVRGEAADVSWIDEAQEIDLDEGADLMAGLVPLQDTKPGSSIIISGTAGEARVGPFWEHLDRLRNADADVGGIDYAADEETDWKIIEDEDAAIELLKSVHPGIGTLTTEEKMRKNWRKLPKPQWAREYLSIWPQTSGLTIIDHTKWAAGTLTRFPTRPARVAFGSDIKPGGSAAAIVAAWRNEAGTAYIEVIEHRQSTAWMPAFQQGLTKRYRGSTIAYDDIAEGKATATEGLRLHRSRGCACRPTARQRPRACRYSATSTEAPCATPCTPASTPPSSTPPSARCAATTAASGCGLQPTTARHHHTRRRYQGTAQLGPVVRQQEAGKQHAAHGRVTVIKLDPSTTSVIATCTDCPYWYASRGPATTRSCARSRTRRSCTRTTTTCEIGSPAASRRAAHDRPVRRCDTRLRSIVSMGILAVLTGRTHGLMSSSVSLPVVSPYSPAPQLPQIVLTDLSATTPRTCR